MASFAITPLTGHTGAEVTGLDFTAPIDGDTRAALSRAFAEHHVLVMRAQHFAPDEFKAAVQLFGELQPHDKKEHHVPDHPDVSYVSNDEFVNGRRIIPGETFHTDHSNHPRPPKATTLFAVELPSRGGDTQYVNMHEAYDDLPAETRQKIDGLKAVHVYLEQIQSASARPSHRGKPQEAAAARHPPAGTHAPGERPQGAVPQSGAHRIHRRHGGRGRARAGRRLMQHATQKKYEYRHQWRHGDWVIWDNRSVMHQANPDYDMNERRYLYRLMLKGEVPE